MKIDRRLVVGSIVLLICINIFSALGLVFQLSMARVLSIEDYGTLGALFSVIYFLGLFTESLQTMVAKYSSSGKADGKIKNVLRRFLVKSTYLSLIVFLIYLVFALPFSLITKIPYLLIAFSGLFIFPAFLIPNTRGVLQGKNYSWALGFNMVLEGILKVTAGLLFVYLGWRVYGAVGGAMLATALAFGFSFLPLRSILRTKEEHADVSEIKTTSGPIFLIILTIMIFYSIDVIIAKIVFSPEIAGFYAITSIISKTIFWGTQPVSKAMFPLSNENNNLDKRKSNLVFLNSVAILVAMTAACLIIFAFFNDEVVYLFSGKNILESASALFMTGLGMAFISISNLILLYKVSINHTRGYKIMPLFILVEVCALLFFSNNLIQFSESFAASSLILLIGSILVLRKNKAKAV